MTPAYTAGARLAFGHFVLDPESGRLLENGRPVPLAPKPFETLYYLAQNAGRVVSKSELMEKIWAGTFVTNDVLVQCVVEIRRVLNDPAKAPQFVQTVPRRGYEFMAAVHPPGPEPSAATATSPGPAATPPASSPVPLQGRLRSQALTAAVGLTLLAVGVWSAWQRAGRGGLSSASGTIQAGSLVVMPLAVEEPVPQSGWLRHGLAEMIGSQLGQTPGIHIVARHRLAAALAQAGFDEDRGPTAEAAARIARALNAEHLVTGSFIRVEDRFVLNAQVVEVMSGRTEGTASVRGLHPGGVLDGVNDLCLKLLHNLRPGAPADVSARPTRMPTESIEAYRQYAEALSHFARGGRAASEEAEKLLDQAVQLDPRFAQAYLKKAEILQWRKQWGYGDPDPTPAVQAAARLSKSLPDRERLLVESFEALIIRDDTALALADWNALLQFYPTYAQEVGVPALAANTLLRLGRWDELILVGEAHVDSPSISDPGRAHICSLLAPAYRRKGEFERALEYARKAVRLWPTREGPMFLNQRVALGRIALEAGHREDALAEFRAASQAPQADVVNLTDAGWGLYMAGQAAEAATLVQRAIALEPSYGNAHHLRGWLHLAHGDYAAATDSFETAFERTPRAFGNAHQGLVSGDLGALYYAGVAYAKAGRREQALATFRRLAEHCQRILQHPGLQSGSGPHWQASSYLARSGARLGKASPEPEHLQGDDTTYYVQSARLHAVQGKRETALRELSQGLALGFGEYRHIQDDPDFESLRNTPEFRRLVSDRLPR